MHEHSRIKAKAALLSIAASTGLTLAKLIAALASGSLALLSEALHGLLDIGATLITYFAVRAADKPADEEHHYGHAKIEAVAALAATGLLIVLSVGVLFEAGRRLLMAEPPPVEATWPVFGVLIVAIIVDFVRWQSLAKVSRETHSDALAADALHFSSDLVASALVLMGLLATSWGFEHGDALAAVGVSVFVAIAGVRLGRRTIDTLVDRAPEGAADDIRAAVLDVPGVAAVEELRLRRAGAAILGEISLGVSRTLPGERIMQLKEEAAAAITRALPRAEVTVTANRRVLDDETALERVLLAAARKRLPIHHVTVQEIGGVKSVGLDLEVDARMSLGAAHEIASGLERAIRDELGPEVEVDTHIEPMEIEELEGQDAESETIEVIAGLLRAIAASGGEVSDIHDVRVRRTPAGLVVNYHCRVDPGRSVADVHLDVDRIDRLLLSERADIARVVGHAEPRKPPG